MTLNGTTVGPDQTLTTLQDVTPPTIIVTSPTVTVMPGITLQGMASDATGILSVTVSGSAVTTSDAFAHWSIGPFSLVTGSNNFSVIATDSASPANSGTTAWTVLRLPDADADGLPDTWQDQYNLVGNARGPMADPDGDGIPNLLEYAFNLDPTTPGCDGLPTAATAINPADGKTYLTYTYRRRIGGGGMAYIVETTSDLMGWNSSGNDIQPIGAPVPNADGITETVTLRVLPSTDSASVRFVRLRVVPQ